jgi:chromosome partitioning protein
MAETVPIPTPGASAEYETLLGQLARQPQIGPLYALTPTQFAKFVAYLFTCAGHRVEDVSTKVFPHGPGVDLNLYADQEMQQLVARVEVRKYAQANPIDSGDVFEFAGVLGGAHAGGIPGYLVSTSTFTGPAYIAEQQHPKLVTLIDGSHLLRYIGYVHGSRAKQADGRERSPVPVGPEWTRRADKFKRPDRTVTRVLTVGNSKGGVAKTVTALELGIGLARRGQRVVVLDVDGQASLTLALPLPTPASVGGGKKAGKQPTVVQESPPSKDTPPGDISDYFAAKRPLQELVRQTAFARLWLVPSGQPVMPSPGARIRSTLHRMDTGGAGHPGDEVAFAEAIGTLAACGAPDGSHYDWIILDTPPAQSRYARAALAAAHDVLICVGAEAFAAQGVNGLLETADAMRALMGGGTTIVGAVITRWQAAPKPALKDARLKLDNSLALEGVSVLGEIPSDDRVDLTNRNAIAGGVMDAVKGLFHFDKSPATVAYGHLIDALLAV